MRRTLYAEMAAGSFGVAASAPSSQPLMASAIF